MDLNYARDTTSGAEGLQLIADLHASRPDIPLIAMTGWANIDTAVQAMRLGARICAQTVEQRRPVQVLRDEIAQARAGAAPARIAPNGAGGGLRAAAAVHAPGCGAASRRGGPASGLGATTTTCSRSATTGSRSASAMCAARASPPLCLSPASGQRCGRAPGPTPRRVT
jgi:hypothetical protein